MTPSAAAVLAVVGGLVWPALALLLGIAIGRSIKEADRREGINDEPIKPCCPHPPEQAPETVRGEFRAIVVPSSRVPAPEPAKRLDRYL